MIKASASGSQVVAEIKQEAKRGASGPGIPELPSAAPCERQRTARVQAKRHPSDTQGHRSECRRVHRNSNEIAFISYSTRHFTGASSRKSHDDMKYSVRLAETARSL